MHQRTGWHRESENTSARTCARAFTPKGLLHSRGTPGIVSRSRPRQWARQFFSAGDRAGKPTRPAYRGCSANPCKGPLREISGSADIIN